MYYLSFFFILMKCDGTSGIPYAGHKLKVSLKNNKPWLESWLIAGLPTNSIKAHTGVRNYKKHWNGGVIAFQLLHGLSWTIFGYHVEQLPNLGDVQLSPLIAMDSSRGWDYQVHYCKPSGHQRRYSNERWWTVQLVAKKCRHFTPLYQNIATIMTGKVTLGAIIDTSILVPMQCIGVEVYRQFTATTH